MNALMVISEAFMVVTLKQAKLTARMKKSKAVRRNCGLNGDLGSARMVAKRASAAELSTKTA